MRKESQTIAELGTRLVILVENYLAAPSEPEQQEAADVAFNEMSQWVQTEEDLSRLTDPMKTTLNFILDEFCDYDLYYGNPRADVGADAEDLMTGDKSHMLASLKQLLKMLREENGLAPRRE